VEITNKADRGPSRTSEAQKKVDPLSMSPSGELVSRAFDMLAGVGDRAAELRQALQENPLDRFSSVAMSGRLQV
jgi:hypothetical protein